MMVKWKISIIMAVGVLLTSVMYDDAFASQNSVTDWQLIYINEQKCKQTDIQLTQEFNSLVIQYLKEYQFDNFPYDPLCVSSTEYENIKSNYDADLTILVFGPSAGKELLSSNYLDGIYIHQGNDRSKNHIIMICDCSKKYSSYEATLTSWVLSHELSHFVLSYKGYASSAIQDIVHSADKSYDSCVGVNFANSNCDNILLKIRPDKASRDYIVMKPYEPAVGNKAVQYLTNDLLNSKFISMQKDYTKLWIANTIDDTTFKENIKNWINIPPDVLAKSSSHPYLYISNGFAIAEVSKNSPKDFHSIKNLYLDDLKKSILPHIPQVESEDEKESEIPTWFTTRARLWTQDRISDSVYFNGLEHLIRTDVIKVN